MTGFVGDQNDNVAADLLVQAANDPSAPALVRGDIVWDYGRLAREAIAFASSCRASGVVDGDRVALVVGSRPEHVACWYGTMLAGAIVVDVSPLLGDEEWLAILRDASPRVIVCDDEYAGRLRRVCGLVGAGDSLVVLGDPSDAHSRARSSGVADPAAVAPKRADDVAIIAYTSGTTGLPKGVAHAHGSVRRQLDLLASLHRLGPGDFVYQAVPLFPLHGFLPQVASAIRGGAAVILADKFSPVDFAEASRRHPITYVTLSSPMLQRVLELPVDHRPDLRSLRVVTVGGAPLQPESRRRFEDALGVHVTQGYGMTEMLGVYVADYDGAPVGSCGRQHPPHGELVVVLDDDGRRLPPGEVGEFAVHRSCALRGYWNDPERTREAFTGEWFRTGDIGRIDEDGYFYLLDRKKDVIIRGGFNIYSAEIERVLVEHPDVAEATVVGAPDDALGEVPVAYVVPIDGVVDANALADALDTFVRERLGSLKSLRQVHVVAYDTLPRNALGKVLKRELRSELIAQRAAV